MTNPTDPRPLRAVTEPGDPSAMTLPRAGSPNHQDATHPSTRKDIPMDIERLAYVAGYPDDELCPRCELREAIHGAVGMLLMLTVLWLIRDGVAELLHQHPRWGWFAAGAGAVMLLGMVTATIERLYLAGWAMWLLTHPVPAWVPRWAVPNTLRGLR